MEETQALRVTKMLKNVINIKTKNTEVLKSENQTIVCINGKFVHISSSNFDKICRSCLLGKSTKNLFNCEHDGYSLRDIFLAVYSIEVKKCDGLPDSLCDECFEAILEIYTFRASVIKSEEILKDIVTKDKEVGTKTGSKSVIQTNESDSPKNDCSESHFTKEKGDSENSEAKCNNFSNNKVNDCNQKKGKTRKRIYKCQHCNLTFNKLQDQKKHVSKEKEMRNDQFEHCNVCNKLFSKSTLTSHKENCYKKKKPEIALQCETCGKKYGTARNLRRHCLSHTGLPHVCQICERGFRESHLLKEHLNIHSGVCPYLCSLCGKSYPTTGALRLHRRYKHEGKKPKVYPKKLSDASKPKSKGSFPCEICGKIYASKTIVNYHVLTHSEEKKFQCNDCGKLFANKSTLGDHRRVHRLSYKCHLCDRIFAYAASLETHINSHTGDKPHVCSVCGKRYSNRSHMREHMRNHTGERPYACNICGKTFAVKGILNTHLKTHNREEGNYICSMCPRVFVDEISVNEHIKDEHADSCSNPPAAMEC